MISPQATIIKKLLKSSVGNKNYDYDHILEVRRLYEKSLNNIPILSKRRKLEWTTIGGVRAAWVVPDSVGDCTIIYVHGGGFVFGLSAIHINYIQRLAEVCRARVLVVDYELSPESKYPVALNQILAVWNDLLDNGIDAKKTIFMGDSAGANLVLAASLKVREMGVNQPACLILACPSLDATFSGESYVKNIDRDPVLNMNKLEYFFDSYIGENNRTDPLISPIFADLHNLPPLLVCVGTEEILQSDSITLSENAKRDHTEMSLYIGDGMWHNWQLSKDLMPESKDAIKTIAEYIISKTV